MKQKKGSLLSRLTSELQEEEEEYEKVEALTWNLKNIQDVWQEHIKTIDSPSTKVLFKSAKLELNGKENTIKVTVGGNRAKDAVLREQSLIDLLREKFRKPTLQIETEVKEDESQKIEKPKAKPSTDREKYSHFLEKNPLLTEFQKRFNLYPPDHNPNKKR